MTKSKDIITNKLLNKYSDLNKFITSKNRLDMRKKKEIFRIINSEEQQNVIDIYCKGKDKDKDNIINDNITDTDNSNLSDQELNDLLNPPEQNTNDISLYNKSSLDLMKDNIPDNYIDLILTDPPYIISKESGMDNLAKKVRENKDNNINSKTEEQWLVYKSKNNITSDEKKDNYIKWGSIYGTAFKTNTDFGSWDKEFTMKDLEENIKQYYLKLKKGGTIIIFFDLWKISYLKEILEKYKFKQIRMIEWIKTNPKPVNSGINYLTNCREIAILAIKGSNPTFNSRFDKGIYNFSSPNNKKRWHSTTKPTPLFIELINKHSNENDIVLDTFLGSGTTAKACIATNRKFIGCEISPEYYKKIFEYDPDLIIYNKSIKEKLEIKPAFHWVGGKVRFINILKKYIPDNYNHYHEIFTATGSLGFNICSENSSFYEINSVITNFYEIVKNNINQLIEGLENIQNEYNNLPTIDNNKSRSEFYYEQRKKFNKIINNNDNNILKSILFIYLQGAGYCGVYRVNGKGEHNVPVGNYKNINICDKENLKKLNLYLNYPNVKIITGDFEISKQNIKKGDFIYIDPPYYPKESEDSMFSGYTKEGFNQEDHNRLIELCYYIDSIGAYFLMSNNNCDYIKNKFSDKKYNIINFSAARTLNGNRDKRKKEDNEILIMNYSIS